MKKKLLTSLRADFSGEMAAKSQAEVDAEFAELMLDNGLDKKLQEVDNAYSVAKSKRSILDDGADGVSEQEPKRMFGMLGPSADELEPIGRDFWKKFTAGVLLSVGVITGLALLGSLL